MCLADTFDNVLLIQHILDATSSLDIDFGLISLDQERTFDRVGHRCLWNILERFTLSPGLIAKIQVLYHDIESVLKHF